MSLSWYLYSNDFFYKNTARERFLFGFEYPEEDEGEGGLAGPGPSTDTNLLARPNNNDMVTMTEREIKH